MVSTIEIKLDTTREEAYAEQQKLNELKKHNEKHDNLVNIITAILAIGWVFFAATEWVNYIIPAVIEPYITGAVIVVTLVVCLCSQALFVDPIDSVSNSYYNAMDKGKIIGVEAWKVSDEENTVDMKLIQENENKEVFYTFITNFLVVLKTDIVNPVFDLDKRVFFIPYEQREMFINAY